MCQQISKNVQFIGSVSSQISQTRTYKKKNNFYLEKTNGKREKQCKKPETKTTVQLRETRALRR